MRYFEEAVIRLYKEGRFASHYHLYIGQEATGAAVLEALGDDDLICTTHRNHGHLIGRGSDPGRTMAEILGRSTGLNRGRGGTLHVSDPSRGFLSTSAIVGGCAGLATGAAFGIKTKRESKVAVGFSAMVRLKRDWSLNPLTSQRCGNCPSSTSVKTTRPVPWVRNRAAIRLQSRRPTVSPACPRPMASIASRSTARTSLQFTRLRLKRSSVAVPDKDRPSSRPLRSGGPAAVHCGPSLRQ